MWRKQDRANHLRLGFYSVSMPNSIPVLWTFVSHLAQHHRFQIYSEFSSSETRLGCLDDRPTTAMVQITLQDQACHWLAISFGHRIRLGVRFSIATCRYPTCFLINWLFLFLSSGYYIWRPRYQCSRSPCFPSRILYYLQQSG